jgi:hypothetical protein
MWTGNLKENQLEDVSSIDRNLKENGCLDLNWKMVQVIKKLASVVNIAIQFQFHKIQRIL